MDAPLPSLPEARMTTECTAPEGGYMGAAEEARTALIEAAREWRKYRQPIMAPAKELRRREALEREAGFRLANAALLWLWHEENAPAISPSPPPDPDVDEIVGRLESIAGSNMRVRSAEDRAEINRAAALIPRLQGERDHKERALVFAGETLIRLDATNGEMTSRALKAEAERDAAVKRAEEAVSRLVAEMEYANASRNIAARLHDALQKIARGDVPADKEGHYLAHREAVNIARAALQPNTASTSQSGEGEKK
jgi:hypothetical protein